MFAVMAIAMGIAASAFTLPAKRPLTNAWFTYNGGAVSVPANYTYSGSMPSWSGSNSLCEFEGIRQPAPNQSLPTQASLNNASSQSNGFTVPKAGIVDFKPYYICDRLL